jgi:hypothetical protein
MQRFLFVCFVLPAFFCSVSTAYGQSAPQSAERLVLESQEGKVKSFPRGAMLHIHGPVGTKPIKGRFQGIGDSLAVEVSGKTVKIPVGEVKAVRRVIWASVVAGGYFFLNVLSSVSLGIFGLSLSGLFLLNAAAISIALSLPYLALAVVLIALGTRIYKVPKWKIKR